MSAPQRVLVIGGLGFIGVNLTERLVGEGRSVTVVTPSRARHLERAAAFEARGVRIVEGDLRDAGAMAAAVADQQIVFNLAGESGAVRSMEDPWTDLDVNCRGNLVLLEWGEKFPRLAAECDAEIRVERIGEFERKLTFRSR